jgi:hypothetical protein
LPSARGDPVPLTLSPYLSPYFAAKAGMAPRSNEDAVIATAESLLRFGLVKP